MTSLVESNRSALKSHPHLVCALLARAKRVCAPLSLASSAMRWRQFQCLSDCIAMGYT